MERKEHPVPVIEKSGGDVLEFLDSGGNPFKPSGSVKYQLVAEDGSVIKEGTIDENSNTISLAGVAAKSFKVLVDSHFVTEVKGIESPEEESEEAPVERFEIIARPTPAGELEEGFESFEDEQFQESIEEGSDNDSNASGSSDNSDDNGEDDQKSSDESGEEESASKDDESTEDNTDESETKSEDSESDSGSTEETESTDSDPENKEDSSEEDHEDSDRDEDSGSNGDEDVNGES